jgi:phage gp29-like protein
MRYVQTEGGLIVPADFAEQPAAGTKAELREIATTRDGRDITRGYVSPFELLQPQDSVLRARGGGNYEIYREVLRDDQVKAVFEQRRLATVSREWEVVPGGERDIDKKAAESLAKQLKAIKWDAVTDKMLYGVFYGYAVAEMLYARDGAEVVMDQIRVRDRRRFGFDGDANPRLLTLTNPNPGELLPERKFWHFCTGADHDDEPYGLGLAHWLYWPVFFKRGGIKFWLIFLEKFGQPTSKGTYPRNATPEEKQRLLSALEAVSTDSGVILPEGMVIELLEAARSGTADYTALYDRMNQAIAKVTLGQTLTTEAAGGQYKADVQMDVRQDIIKADADLVCESFNRGPARWLTDWNYPDAAYPRVFRRIEDEPDLKPQAERDEIIGRLGFKPTLKYVQDTYGSEWEEKPAGTPPPFAPGAEFAEAARGSAVDAQIERVDREAQPALDAMIEQIRALVEQARSFDELRDNLIKLYPALDEQKLGAVMQQALAAAALAGRYDILEQVRGG